MSIENHETGAVGAQQTVEVQVKSLVTSEKVTFSMPVGATLDQVWQEAYSKLDEERRDGDTFQCAEPDQGKSLMSDLQVTLEQARGQRLCGSAACHYEIKGPSGGAGRVGS